MQANRNSLIEELLAESMREGTDSAESARREEIPVLEDIVIDSASLGTTRPQPSRSPEEVQSHARHTLAQRLTGSARAPRIRKIPPPLPK